MAKKKHKYNPRPQVIVRQNNYYFLNHEKMCLEAHYDFLDCNVKPVKGKLCIVEIDLDILHRLHLELRVVVAIVGCGVGV